MFHLPDIPSVNNVDDIPSVNNVDHDHDDDE